MKNTSKKIIKAVSLGIMALVISAPLIAKPVEARVGYIEKNIIIDETIETAIYYKTMPDGLLLINIMGNHDDVVDTIFKLQEKIEMGTIKDIFLISSLDDIRNTEAHIFVSDGKVSVRRERLQYEGSPDNVKEKKEELEAEGYIIEGYIEYSGDISPEWAKVVAIKTTEY